MMDISECLRPDSRVYITRDRDCKKGFLYKDENPELFIKDFNHAEFIGEELCDVQNIRCVHYFLVGCGLMHLKRFSKVGEIKEHYKYKIASIDFRKDDMQYKTIGDYVVWVDPDKIGSMLKYAPTAKNKEDLRSDLLKMVALDIYMGQTDRLDHNFMFEEDKSGNIRLAPLYDFEYSLKSSYLDRGRIYESDLVTFNNMNELKSFMRKYPEFRDMLLSYLDVDLCSCISRAYNQRQLKVPSDKWQFYEEFQDERCELIKKITR